MAGFHIGRSTQTADTVITGLIPGKDGGIARITGWSYTCAGTPHTVTFMRPVATTTATAGAAAAQKDVVVASVNSMKDSSGAAENLAAADYVVYQTTGGGYELNTVASFSTLTVTLGTNIAVAIASGSTIWIFGEVGRAVHPTFLTVASINNDLSDARLQAGLPAQADLHNQRSGVGDPLIVHSDNETAAGILRYATGVYAGPTDVTTT